MLAVLVLGVVLVFGSLWLGRAFLRADTATQLRVLVWVAGALAVVVGVAVARRCTKREAIKWIGGGFVAIVERAVVWVAEVVREAGRAQGSVQFNEGGGGGGGGRRCERQCFCGRAKAPGCNYCRSCSYLGWRIGQQVRARRR